MRSPWVLRLAASVTVALIMVFQPGAGAEERLPDSSCEELLVLVDKEHSLSSWYIPPDLVFLGDYGVPFIGWNGMLREEAAEHLEDLVAAAGSEGKELVVASAYRSFYDQSLTYAFYTSLYGSEAGRVSATPGHSEQQLGTTVDFTNAAAGYQIQQTFGDTEAARWLRENAAEYGFVLSYPKGEEEKTGYVWEPWHYRYVGVEKARAIRETGINAKDFLIDEGVKPSCA